MSSFFFFNDTATTEIYTLSLHDALPISAGRPGMSRCRRCPGRCWAAAPRYTPRRRRSEEHTSELQSLAYLVCRLLLEKKNHHYIPPRGCSPLAEPLPPRHHLPLPGLARR